MGNLISLSAQTDTVKVAVSHLARIDTIKAQPAVATEDVLRMNRIDTIRVLPVTQKIQVLRMARIDTIKVETSIYFDSTLGLPGGRHSLPDYYIDPATKHKRIIVNTALHSGLYLGSMLILNNVWYADYARSSFHTFNDNKEWKQIDKAGHAWSAYQLSRTSAATWKWAGLNRKRQIWIGGLAGVTFQTVIEVLDGFSAEWGWSWGDITANFVGSGLYIGQQLAWNEQRVSYKFSFHSMHYSDKLLNLRSDTLFGGTLQERALKDYNGQAYWLSANLKSFFPKSNLPAWLNVAFGMGASGMFGATENKWQSGYIKIDRTDIPRLREWYLAPDIDFTRIPTKSKLLRKVFFVLNAFKFPAPALMLSNGKLKLHAIYF